METFKLNEDPLHIIVQRPVPNITLGDGRSMASESGGSVDLRDLPGGDEPGTDLHHAACGGELAEVANSQDLFPAERAPGQEYVTRSGRASKKCNNSDYQYF